MEENLTYTLPTLKDLVLGGGIVNLSLWTMLLGGTMGLLWIWCKGSGTNDARLAYGIIRSQFTLLHLVIWGKVVSAFAVMATCRHIFVRGVFARVVFVSLVLIVVGIAYIAVAMVATRWRLGPPAGTGWLSLASLAATFGDIALTIIWLELAILV